ncbi:MAG: hypothetical protein QNK37_31385 [Acidobacteriota bacterium]|nr:hypothetical protein [Acidobacteriota bacterium]
MAEKLKLTNLKVQSFTTRELLHRQKDAVRAGGTDIFLCPTFNTGIRGCICP